jgi:hypothetical protein
MHKEKNDFRPHSYHWGEVGPPNNYTGRQSSTRGLSPSNLATLAPTLVINRIQLASSYDVCSRSDLVVASPSTVALSFFRHARNPGTRGI